MKYVIIDQGGLEIPIIFPEVLDHACFKGMNPISAGFVNLYGAEGPLPTACCGENAIDVSVFGESTGLKLKSRPEDKELLTREIMRHYN